MCTDLTNRTKGADNVVFISVEMGMIKDHSDDYEYLRMELKE